MVFVSASWTSGGLVAQMSAGAGANAGSHRPAWTLTDAPINRVVKRRILSQLKDYFAGGDLLNAGDSTVSLVKLNPAGQVGIWLFGPEESCGATGNCLVWIFDGKTGAELLSDDGWDYGFRSTMHHGVYDFYMRANMSCCTGTLHEYRFDGKIYKLTLSVRETTQ